MTAIHSEVSRHRDIEEDGDGDDIRQQSLLRFPRSVSDTHDVDNLSGDEDHPDTQWDSPSPDRAQRSESLTSENLRRDQRDRGHNLTADEELPDRTWESPSPEKTNIPESLREEDTFYDQKTQSLSTLHEEQILDDDEQDGSIKLSTNDNDGSTPRKEQDNKSEREEILEEATNIHDNTIKDTTEEQLSEDKRSDSLGRASCHTKDRNEMEDARDDSRQLQDETISDTTNTQHKGNCRDTPERRSSQTEEGTETEQTLEHRPSSIDHEEQRSLNYGEQTTSGNYNEERQISPPRDNENTTAEREIESINSPEENEKHRNEELRKESNASSVVKKESATPGEDIASSNGQPDVVNDVENTRKVSPDNISRSLTREDIERSPNMSLASRTLSEKDNGIDTLPRNMLETSSRVGEQNVNKNKKVDERVVNSSGTVASGASGNNVMKENISKTHTNERSHSINDEQDSPHSKGTGVQDSGHNEERASTIQGSDTGQVSDEHTEQNNTAEGNNGEAPGSGVTSNQTPDGLFVPALSRDGSTGSY